MGCSVNRPQWIIDYFYDLLHLLLSEDSCKEREFGTEVREIDRQGDKKCCTVS